MAQLFYCPDIQVGDLPAEEVQHCRVLRKQVGQVIQLTDGQGNFYQARLTHIDWQRGVQFLVEEVLTTPQLPYFIHLAIAPTKNIERIEWLVEKCVEIGIQKISFIATARTERTRLRMERLEKIAISAMKQSLQSRLPILQDVMSLADFLPHCQETQRFMAYIDESVPLAPLAAVAQPRQRYCVLVGPEGDFTPEEVALAQRYGFECVSLGSHRLRTETAGLYITFVLNFLNV